MPLYPPPSTTPADLAALEDRLQRPLLAGQWRCPVSGRLNAAAQVADSLILVPFVLLYPETVSHLGTRVTTGSAGNGRIYVYASNAADRPTGNPLAATANIDTSVAGDKEAAIAGGNVELPAGLLWFGFIFSATPSIQALSSDVIWTGRLIGTATLAAMSSGSTTGLARLTFAHVFGTDPDLTGQAFVEGSAGGALVGYLRAP